MALTAGEKLGPYEILSPIGEGGMGEVYKARDTRLDRFVAVKVLPEHIAKREDLRARFEREARAVASLNHPHICVLYDIGNQDGAGGYMVMEYLEGETLEACLERGALPLDGALRYATQISDALDRAHRAGVTHRDIKPGNIIITRDGVKVLDFGLAKSTAKPGPTDATIVKSLTTEGMVLGTPQYMAPEQFEGKEAGARSDIWAFGAVLYEMVTGRKAFEGKNYTSLVAAILGGEPARMAVKPFTPSWLERLVKRCLQKDAEDRWQSMRDIVLELRTPPQESAAATAPSQAARWPWVAAVAVLAATLGVALWAPWRAPAPAPEVIRFAIAPPDKHSFDIPLQLSPDGRQLLFKTGNGGPFQGLWVRSLDTLKARQIVDAGGPQSPFWSPDSRFIAFTQEGKEGKLKKVDIAGGPPTMLIDAPRRLGGGAWSKDGVIVFGSRDGGGLMRVPSSGGVPAALTKLDETRGETSHTFPSFLSDQKHFVYLRRSTKAEFTGIYIGVVDAPPERQNPHRLLATEGNAVYTPTPDPRQATRGLGFLLFLRDSTLLAQPFDAGALALQGEPVPIADNVDSTSFGLGRFSASWNGGLVYSPGGGSRGLPTQLTWFDRQGKSLGAIGNPGTYASLAISPDGSRVAADKMAEDKRDGSSRDLWLIDASPGGKSDRFTFTPGYKSSPVWSPDGSEIIFSADRGLFTKPSNLAGNEQEVLQAVERVTPNDWSRDGKTLSFSNGANGTDVWTLNLSGKKPTEFFKSEGRDYGGRFSPDGRWLAYVSDLTGRREIYVRSFPANEASGQQMVSLGGGRLPLWRRDGKELYYRSMEDKVMAVAVTPGAVLKFGQPKVLFSPINVTPQNGPYNSWDVTADGSKFLLNIMGTETAQAASLTLVLNWTAALKQAGLK